MKSKYEGLKAQLVWDGGDHVAIPPECGEPRDDQMIGTTPERLAEVSGRTCYDPATEVLTRDGWVRFDQLQRDVEVATFNAASSRMEFQFPTDYIKKRHVGKMYRVNTSKVSIFVTPDHNLFVSDYTKSNWRLASAESVAGERYHVLRHALYEAAVAEPILMSGRTYTQKFGKHHVSITRTAAGHAIDVHQLHHWAALLGYYISEGCAYFPPEGPDRPAPRVAIYQKRLNAKPILEAAEGCGFTVTTSLDERNDVLQIRVGGAALARYLKPFGSPSKNKRLPGYVFEWPVELRETLLDAMMFGDGTTTKQGIRVYNTNSRGLAYDVQRLIISLGRPCSINHSECESCHMYRVRETAYGEASVNKHRRQDEWIDYDGDVYCVSVPNKVLVTRRDEKVVICGNCYDSMGKNGSRPSSEYHKHILGTGHGSVLGHWHTPFEFDWSALSIERRFDLMRALANRPGIYINLKSIDTLRLTTNFRSITEWMKWSKKFHEMGYLTWNDAADRASQALQASLQKLGWGLAPQIMEAMKSSGKLEEVKPPMEYESIFESAKTAEPKDDFERWVTIYMEGSRGFSHEEVRHGYATGISQRSTRFCDENESPWIMHPLLQEYLVDNKVPLADREEAQVMAARAEESGKSAYATIVDKLQPWCAQRIPESDKYRKTTARKQARGAGRGYLGNGLKTLGMFSASVSEWLWKLSQRAANAADAEIRVEYGMEVLPELRKSRYGYRFAHLETEPAGDGVGLALKGGGNK